MSTIIKSLPENDFPKLYGLPTSIDKKIQRIYNIELTNNIKALTSADASDLKFNREKWAATLEPTFTLWNNLDKNIMTSGLVEISAEELNTKNPLNSFVVMEAVGCHETYRMVKASFERLDRVVNGNDVLTSDIQEEGTKILTGQVPSKWNNAW